MQRIVVTGMGLVTPLGLGSDTVWERLLTGTSGIRRLSDDIVGDLATKIGAQVPDTTADALAGFDADRVASPKDQRKMDRFILFALAAAEEALRQAAWMPQSDTERRRTATVIGTGTGGFPAIVDAVHTVERRGARRLSPFTVPSYMANLAAGPVSIKYGFKGPLGAPVTACAASVQALGDAARLIRTGEADVAVCGGAESCVETITIAAFGAARALATRYNDTPSAASRPFDRARDGFVIAEGAGILVIESLDHARARGARPFAELVGYGTTSDAYHVTSGPKDGDGASRAMRLALAQAGLDPTDIQHLNAHATSTEVGDRGELEAIKAVFGVDGKLAVSATKSATGHLLGAAGAAEAIFTILALRDQIAPATLNLGQPDPASQGVHLVAGAPLPLSMEHAMSNGFGFGGVNASVVFRRCD